MLQTFAFTKSLVGKGQVQRSVDNHGLTQLTSRFIEFANRSCANRRVAAGKNAQHDRLAGESTELAIRKIGSCQMEFGGLGAHLGQLANRVNRISLERNLSHRLPRLDLSKGIELIKKGLGASRPRTTERTGPAFATQQRNVRLATAPRWLGQHARPETSSAALRRPIRPNLFTHCINSALFRNREPPARSIDRSFPRRIDRSGLKQAKLVNTQKQRRLDSFSGR